MAEKTDVIKAFETAAGGSAEVVSLVIKGCFFAAFLLIIGYILINAYEEMKTGAKSAKDFWKICVRLTILFLICLYILR